MLTAPFKIWQIMSFSVRKVCLVLIQPCLKKKSLLIYILLDHGKGDKCNSISCWGVVGMETDE